jgi:hypothetical protein
LYFHDLITPQPQQGTAMCVDILLVVFSWPKYPTASTWHCHVCGYLSVASSMVTMRALTYQIIHVWPQLPKELNMSMLTSYMFGNALLCIKWLVEKLAFIWHYAKACYQELANSNLSFQWPIGGSCSVFLEFALSFCSPCTSKSDLLVHANSYGIFLELILTWDILLNTEFHS